MPGWSVRKPGRYPQRVEAATTRDLRARSYRQCGWGSDGGLRVVGVPCLGEAAGGLGQVAGGGEEVQAEVFPASARCVKPVSWQYRDAVAQGRLRERGRVAVRQADPQGLPALHWRCVPV